MDSTGFTKDFWEYNPVSNKWIRKADFGGLVRYAATGFSIGSKGYIGTGVAVKEPFYLKDFWEWDQATNVWTQKENIHGKRAEAVGFSSNGFGYVGLGTTMLGSGTVSDFWRYNPKVNKWVQIADFGGGIRELVVSFSIGKKGFVGTGWVWVSWLELSNQLFSLLSQQCIILLF